jgi:hypothetical protein
LPIELLKRAIELVVERRRRFAVRDWRTRGRLAARLGASLGAGRAAGRWSIAPAGLAFTLFALLTLAGI